MPILYESQGIAYTEERGLTQMKKSAPGVRGEREMHRRTRSKIQKF
jgi:hypothetical protein